MLTSDHLTFGALLFARMDQCDVTGPFEVLSRVNDSSFLMIARTKDPVTDARGLVLSPNLSLSEAPQVDVLLIPGGPGQQDLMMDEAVLSFIRSQAHGAKLVFSVCTGALLAGAAGLLTGVEATTHWAALPILSYFGAIPVNRRVVVDGKYVSAAGVTSGLDGALRIVALLRGDRAAQEIQLGIEYFPDPPFDSGSPDTAPREVLDSVRESLRPITEARLATARRLATQFGVTIEDSSGQ